MAVAYVTPQPKQYIYYTNVVGVSEHPFSPYCGFEQIANWHPTNGDVLRIALDGSLKYNLWECLLTGKYDWRSLLIGKGLLLNDEEGRVFFNSDVVESSESIINADGKRQVTVKIRKGMTFSDGTPIKAENYLGKFMVESSPIYLRQSNLTYKLDGYDTFSTAEQQTVFSGVKMPDDYTMVFVYDKEYVNYFWAEELFDLYPYPNEIYLGRNRIVVSEQGVSLPDSAYEKDENGRYVLTKTINDNMLDYSFATSGKYKIVSVDEDKTTWIRLESVDTRQTVELQSYSHGNNWNVLFSSMSKPIDVDFIKYDKYLRKNTIQIRNVGTLKYDAVREAIGYIIDWGYFEDYSGQDAQYNYSLSFDGFWAEDTELSSREQNIEKAIEILEEDGWIFNADGTLYDKSVGDVRYKKVENLTRQEIEFFNATGSYAKWEEYIKDNHKVEYIANEKCYLVPLKVQVFSFPQGVEYIMQDSFRDYKAAGLDCFLFEWGYLLDDYKDANGWGNLYFIALSQQNFAYDMRGSLPFADEADSVLIY